MTGRVDHSTAGAQHAARRDLRARLLAYVIAGHHAGLPDHVGEGSSLSARLEKEVPPIDAAPAEIREHPLPRLPRLDSPDRSERRRGFTLAFSTRMLFSCLVDADFLDTERFMDRDRASLRTVDSPSCASMLERLDDFLAGKQKGIPQTPVNRRRAEVLERCRERAAEAPGFFSLHVPTGGGKTLSSLAFGLAHAARHGLHRVVYAIPFTSIIEQTADIFREALGDLGDQLLEHHGNLDADDPARQSARLRLAAENFDAPLIVTTNVQLFESLFAFRPSRCRKLHRLARSVIILDEVQSLPPRLLAPTLAALEELVRNYGSTVVLCTATQPALEKRREFSIGLENIRPIVDDPSALHDSLRRVSVERRGRMENADLVRSLREEKQVLCVVNSRRHAADLFAELKKDPSALHLSASMCAEHRSKVVAEIRRRLKEKEPCRVLSTQVIEAGVDVDFPTVYRASAGLDSITQAAGRCNREGTLLSEDGQPRLGRVIVFDYDTKAYPTNPSITQAAGHFREIAGKHDDLLSPRAVEHYFQLHYWQQGGDGGSGWDRGVGDESVMGAFVFDRKHLLHASFRRAAAAYRLIDDSQVRLIVPFGDRGRKLIAELQSLPDSAEPWQLRNFDRRAQRFVVGVYEQGLQRLHQNSALMERHGRFYLASNEAYDPSLGLRFDVPGLDPDMLVV